MQVLHFLSCGRTDTGMVRDHNEDAILERPEAGLWAVADGMGGHSAGDVASTMVVETLADLRRQDTLSGYVDALEDALMEVNHRLRALARQRGTQAIGATVATLLTRGQHGVCVWAGDSRVYRMRDGDLQQVSQDHALVSELLASGVISPEQAADHPHGNLVTRAVGAADDLDLDMEIVDLEDGDVFLLCSDGLDKELQRSEIVEVLRGTELAQVPDALVELTLARGARDNVSVVVVKVDASAAGSRSLSHAAGQGDAGEDTLPDFALQDLDQDPLDPPAH